MREKEGGVGMASLTDGRAKDGQTDAHCPQEDIPFGRVHRNMLFGSRTQTHIWGWKCGAQLELP